MHHYLDKDDLLREIIKIQNDPKADKTMFATYCMLIINNLRKRPQFSGYTTNWTEDYISNSIYKMLKYIHNFDHTRISKITNEPVSPFAYLTQIAKAAFLEVINKRKSEESHIKETFQYQELESLLRNVNSNIENQSSLGTSIEELENGIKEYNLRTMTLEGIKFDSVYDILLFLQNRGETKISVIYPKKYVISLDEYDKICTLKPFEIMKLVRKTYKQKKKEELIEEEEEILFDPTDIDEWSTID